ncbi:Fe-S cluster assembly protein SufD [Methyloligella sp. 2.7D]|uniref:Fe-S cluster assembly protein SufD n=1 Tax=unclassified Methyloligella TaxID=2625955 RepID=UPI00157C5F63|nr:Fe-S cluster assembly protein SufD [Methyloligella sp. GL2]QKP77799.1 Fe-S cluster assembly protein SufD [Methyloligella sp. GL2]
MDLPVKQLRSKAEQDLLDVFSAVNEALPGAENKTVAKIRSDALADYASVGLPHRRVEAWKYTDLRSQMPEAFPLVQASGRAISDAEIETALSPRIAGIDAYRLVVAEGEFRPELSDVTALKEKGAELHSLAETLEHLPEELKPLLAESGYQRSGFEVAPTATKQIPDPIIALNKALMTGGVILRLKQGAALDKPVHLINLDGEGEPSASVTRAIVVLEKGTSLDLIESYASLGGRGLQRNAMTQIVLGESAAIEHSKLQLEDAEAMHLANLIVTMGAEARYNGFQYSLGARLSRNDVRVLFEGEGGTMSFNGAALLKDSQHCDTTMVVEHMVPHCTSRELYKAVLDGDSRGVFQAKVIVAPDAQKTDGKQMGQALLLSQGAEFDTKPELEIFADDVVCGHGATSGQIDEDLLFYLEARGIPEPTARALLIQAFVGEALEQIEDEPVREALTAATADWLGVAFD